MADRIREISDRENDADDIICAVLQDVRHIFVTPFAHSAITGLIGVMDDAIDQMNQTAKAVELYELTTFTPQMQDMHTITGAIVGVGASRRLSAVRWNVASSIIVAWVVTLPAAAAIGAGLF